VLERPKEDYRSPRLSVLPISVAERIEWIDPAGYTVASSDRAVFANWLDVPSLEFELIADQSLVTGQLYQRNL
jgi:hypothetical protein